MSAEEEQKGIRQAERDLEGKEPGNKHSDLISFPLICRYVSPLGNLTGSQRAREPFDEVHQGQHSRGRTRCRTGREMMSLTLFSSPRHLLISTMSLCKGLLLLLMPLLFGTEDNMDMTLQVYRKLLWILTTNSGSRSSPMKMSFFFWLTNG